MRFILATRVLVTEIAFLNFFFAVIRGILQVKEKLLGPIVLSQV